MQQHNMTHLKEKLFNACEDFLNDRQYVIENTISEILKALESETKSSAGDKHETGRAMLQLEREKAGQQLGEVENLREQLKKIDTQSKHNIIALGSVIHTSGHNYFIAISAGKLNIEDTSYYAISVATPMAKVLLGKQVGDFINFREASFKILAIQ